MLKWLKIDLGLKMMDFYKDLRPNQRALFECMSCLAFSVLGTCIRSFRWKEMKSQASPVKTCCPFHLPVFDSHTNSFSFHIERLRDTWQSVHLIQPRLIIWSCFPKYDRPEIMTFKTIHIFFHIWIFIAFQFEIFGM